MGQDYYILFRDTAVPVPTDIEYKKRSEQEDVLLSDKALYVWGYAGTLSEEQAEIVKQGFDSFVDKRLKCEPGYLVTSLGSIPYETEFQSKTYKMAVKAREPACREFFARKLPNLGFLPYVPLHQTVRIYPESTAEKWRIINKLRNWSAQEQHGFSFYCRFNKQEEFESHKRHRSFVELLSLETLMDVWQRFGYFRHMDLLRRTAGIWVRETLERNRIIHTKRNRRNPEDIKTIFESFVHDDKEYIPALTLRQQVVLGKCVDIINSTRTADGCGAENIDNIYRALLEKSSQTEQAERAVRKAEREAKQAAFKAKHTEYTAKKSEYEAMKAEYEAIAAEYEAIKAERKAKRDANTDDDSDSPSLMQAASGRGNSISAIDAYNASIEWANDPAEVIVKNEGAITVSIDDASIDKMSDAVFRGLLQNRYADKVDRWDYISQTKYGGTGWMELARADLRQQKDEVGKPKPFTDKEATSYSHVIRRAVEARREDRAQGKKQSD